jgi:hypothetical protein
MVIHEENILAFSGSVVRPAGADPHIPSRLLLQRMRIEPKASISIKQQERPLSEERRPSPRSKMLLLREKGRGLKPIPVALCSSHKTRSCWLEYKK